MTTATDQNIKVILSKLPKDLKPYAAIIIPAISKMVRRDGWDTMRQFVFNYKGNDRSWDRRLQRNMTVHQRSRWRLVMSHKRMKELAAHKARKIEFIKIRRQIVQRLTTSAVEILIGLL